MLVAGQGRRSGSGNAKAYTSGNAGLRWDGVVLTVGRRASASALLRRYAWIGLTCGFVPKVSTQRFGQLHNAATEP
jgi:hypothetical protein